MVDILTGQQAAKVVWAEQDYLLPHEVDVLRAIAGRLLAGKDARLMARRAAKEARVRGHTLRIWCHDDSE